LPIAFGLARVLVEDETKGDDRTNLTAEYNELLFGGFIGNVAY